VKVDNVPVSISRDVQREILSKKVGQSVQLELWRNGKAAMVSLRTGEQPDRMARASNRRPQAEPPPVKVPPTSNHGMTIEDAQPGAALSGVIVRDVAPGSAADAAGLLPGDVITEVAGKPVKGKSDFEAVIARADLTRGIMLLVERDGQRTFAILKP
jgi:serine protease Do